MKNIFIITLFSIGLLTSCRDKDQDTDMLPEATQSGKNTGGALVDGKIWVAKIENPNINVGQNNTHYEFVNGQYMLQIHLRHVENTEDNSITFILLSSQDFGIGTCELYDNEDSKGVYFLSPKLYFTDRENSGVLQITKFDKTNKFISGTFNFKARYTNGTAVSITEGRFDRKILIL